MPQISREGIQSNDTLIIRIDPEKIPQQKLVALDEVLTEEVMEALDLGKRVVCLLRGEHEEDGVSGVDVTVYTIIGYHASTAHEYIEFVIDIGGPQPVSMGSYPNAVFGATPPVPDVKYVIDLSGTYEPVENEIVFNTTYTLSRAGGGASNYGIKVNPLSSLPIEKLTLDNFDVVFPENWNITVAEGGTK